MKHKCKFCGRRFRQLETLKRHVAVHAIEENKVNESCNDPIMIIEVVDSSKTNDNDFIDTTPVGFSDRKSDKELMKDTDTGPDIIKPKGSHSSNLCEKNYTSKI